MKTLVLEDSNERIKWFRQRLIGMVVDYAYTSVQANQLLLDNVYDFIFLDHDLSEEHYEAMYHSTGKHLVGTGVDTAKFIVENKCSPKSHIVIHSLNPVGRQNMFEILHKDGYHVDIIPYLYLHQFIR